MLDHVLNGERGRTGTDAAHGKSGQRMIIFAFRAGLPLNFSRGFADADIACRNVPHTSLHSD